MSASDHLNYRQIDKFVQRANAGGGFSVKAFGPDAGREAENVHMVGTGSRHGLDIYPAEVGGDVHASTEQGMAFTETRENALRSPNAYWGGWHGGNRISYDVSRSFPQTRRGEQKARRFAVKRGEEAIGTVGRFSGGKQSYAETSNPFHGKDRTLNPSTREWINEPLRKKRGEAGPQ